MVDVSERSFEAAIESALLWHGPDAPTREGSRAQEAQVAYGEVAPGGYRRRLPEEFDRGLCLIPRDVLDFVYASQPMPRLDTLPRRHVS